MNDSEREAFRLEEVSRIRAALSDAGRVRTAERAGGATTALSIATYGIAGWLFFLPVGYVAAVTSAVVVSLAWLALLRKLSVKGFGVLDASCLLFLGLALIMRALLDVELVDPVGLAWPSVVLGGVFGLGFGTTQQGMAWKLLTVTFTMVVAASLLALVNVAYDTGEPQRFRVQVDAKDISRGSRSPTTYSLHFAPAPDLAALDVRASSVSASFYDRTSIGDRLCFEVHPGALWMPWYEVQPLAKCPSRSVGK